MKTEPKIITLNPKKDHLTPEILRTFKGCEQLNDQEATETVFAIQTFANILYELMSEQTNEKIRKAA